MLAVFAHAQDAQARAFAERWAAPGVRLMTLRDLSLPGWRHQVGARGPERAVIGGERIDAAALRGVITRVPAVLPAHLPHIVPEDRQYVAAELNAFLTSWLSRLPCPVLNRPTASCLLGPNLGPERWGQLALGAGLAVARARFEAPADPPRPEDTWRVVVVGGRWVGEAGEALGAGAVRLAAAAGAELLVVHYTRPQGAFLSADAMVDLGDEAVARALLERFHLEAAA